MHKVVDHIPCYDMQEKVRTQQAEVQLKELLTLDLRPLDLVPPDLLCCVRRSSTILM